jgi:hypothetical protein
MKSLTYIFAIILTATTITNSFATDKGKDKNIVKSTPKVELRTEIATLIEEDATLSEVNLIVSPLNMTETFITDLIEVNAANNLNVCLDICNPSTECMANTNEVKLNSININENTLLNFIDTNTEVQTIK